MKTIPLSVPNLSGKEWEYIKDCLDTNWVSSVGSYVDRFEQEFARFVGAEYAVSTVNGTAALHIALLLAQVKPSDLVIVPNVTFVASVNAIRYCGANPILIDITPDTWQLDTNLLEEFLERNVYYVNDEPHCLLNHKRIKAIMPVHILGNMCEMQKIIAIAEKYNITVVEDATEALGSCYEGIHAGKWGTIGCFSFNGNKIMTTGGGGMIVTDDEILAKKAKHLTTQAKSDPFEYIHDEIGYNYRLVNILAAMGLAQLEQMPIFLRRKKEINNFYRNELKEVEAITFQKINENVSCNYWLFTISHNRQKEVIECMTQKHIQVRPFWLPMNRLKMFEKELYIMEKDVSFEVYKKSISLPCSTNITDEELEKVVTTLKSI
ncbi:MAG: LegC family aminotransferase [Thermoflexibacter sp.]